MSTENRPVNTRIAFALAALLVPAAAQADPFCDTLKSVLAAGEEAKPFTSLRTGGATADLQGASTKTFPGFKCGISAELTRSYFTCRQPSADGAALQASLTKQATACVGATAKTEVDYSNDTVSEIAVGANRATTLYVRWSPSEKQVSLTVLVEE